MESRKYGLDGACEYKDGSTKALILGILRVDIAYSKEQYNIGENSTIVIWIGCVRGNIIRSKIDLRLPPIDVMFRTMLLDNSNKFIDESSRFTRSLHNRCYAIIVEHKIRTSKIPIVIRASYFPKNKVVIPINEWGMVSEYTCPRLSVIETTFRKLVRIYCVVSEYDLIHNGLISSSLEVPFRSHYRTSYLNSPGVMHNTIGYDSNEK